MYNKLAVVLFAGIAAVACNDLNVGRPSGRKIYDETIQASPAIWRQSQKVEIKANETEVISGIVVTDQRDYKDGDAQIIEGGEGQSKVVIQLMSPAVFRGLYFHVVVYAEPTMAHPGILGKDIDVYRSTPDSEGVTDDVDDFSTTPVPSGKSTEPSANQTRLNRDTQHIDSIFKYIGDKTTEVPAQGESDVTMFGAKSVSTNAPSSSAPAWTDKVISTATTYLSTTTSDGLSTTTSDGLSTTTSDDLSTGATDVTKPISSPNKQNFDSISKELGQKVLFGIKNH